MILTSEDVSNAHVGIVNRIAEKERSRPISASNNEVSDVVRQEALLAVNEVHELNAAVQGHPKAQGRSYPLLTLLLLLLDREVPAGPCVAWRLPRGHLCTARSLELQR